LPQPATVRPQGLVTLSAVYALRAPAGFVSFRRRSWDLPFGACSARKVPAAFPRGWTHVPFLLSVLPSPKRGPAQQAAASGLSPFRACLATGRGLTRRPLAAPLGFALLRSPGECLARDFARTPPTRFSEPAPQGQLGGAPEYQSALAWPRREPPVIRSPHGTTLSGFLHRHDPEHSSDNLPELWVHRMPRRTLLPTGRHSLGSHPRSTGVVRASH
jgi:hypothetical protein